MLPSGWSRRRFLASLAASSGAALVGGSGCAFPPGLASPAGDLTALDLLAAARAVRARTVSPVDLTRACLDRIARLDGQLNAFITVTAERAMAEAREAEAEVARGRWRGPLHGVPVALKDNVDTAGVRTTAASAVYADRVPAEDAEVVTRLRASGAVVLGKLNMHEFAVGTSGSVGFRGPTRNPWALDHVAGGSSSGSGAAVAAGLCYGAVGTDTGGSVRIPAACCGVVGLKPTYGLVSARGVVPLSPSYDHVGPLARTVADVAALLAAMTGAPPALDPDAPPSVAGLRVGVLLADGALCDTAAEPEVQAAVDAAVEVIRALVAEVRAAAFATPDLSAIIGAELAEYHAPILAAAGDRYDARTRAEVSGGALPRLEADRLRAELARFRASAHEAFGEVDLLVSPTLPTPALPLREAGAPFAQASCTFPFNTAGLPAVSVPCGFTTAGLPIGLQIAGPMRGEARVLALAQAYERASDWHRRRPTLA